ncbi:MAG: hypothetical protein WC370_05210 [Dehalococcoidales bacterium]
MIILWIRKKNADNAKAKDDESFKKHDDIMKRFRLAHPDLNIISSRDILTAEGSLLAPIDRIKLADHVQN